MTIPLTIFFFFDTHYQVIFTNFLNGVNKSRKDKGRKEERKKEKLREREREKKEDKIKSKREKFMEEKDKIEKKTNKKKDRNKWIRQSNQSNQGLRSADYMDQAANKRQGNLARTCTDTKGRVAE